MKSTVVLIILFFFSSGFFLQAQEKAALSFTEFLNEVKEKNLDYTARKYSISMAEASILSAGIFPDPQLETEVSDNGISKSMGYTIGTSISWTLELGQKRKARIETAKNEAEFTRLQVQDFLRNLVADATIGYVEGLKAKALAEVQRDSYLHMLKLAQSDSIRYRLGDISLVTSKQSKLEAASLRNEMYASESNSQQAVSALTVFIGSGASEKELQGNLHAFNREFGIDDLIEYALNSRTDLLASRQNIETAASWVRLEKANRIIDVGISLGAQHNTAATNEIAPSPAANAIKLGASIPLKFSNRRNADLKIAEMGRLQAETEYRQTENIIRTEVMQAYQQYQATQKQLKQFDNGMLSDAKSILDGISYSYRRGESSILEVLNAQRTYNDIRLDYFRILADNALFLIELERKAGIWDIDF